MFRKILVAVGGSEDASETVPVVTGLAKAFDPDGKRKAQKEAMLNLRELPDRKQDSGWRMFSGHEPEGYVDDPSNLSLVMVGLLLDKDPTLLEPLKGSVGEAFENSHSGIFKTAF